VRYAPRDGGGSCFVVHLPAEAAAPMSPVSEA
jgi:hypothetical protein